jgi:NADPH-dependent 2,4-dienoyl-CoA reductase/sulfur reductase-like enzyme
VTRLDSAGRAVELRTAIPIAYDKLPARDRRRAGAALGARQRPRGSTTRTLADSERIVAELRPGRRLTVIGAGFIGAEVAAAAHTKGLDVSVD